jgi:hypothetical protein
MYMVEMYVRGKWIGWHAFRHKPNADEYMQNCRSEHPYYDWRIKEVKKSVTEFDTIRELLLQWNNPEANEIQV